jgi:hypothetical protein
LGFAGDARPSTSRGVISRFEPAARQADAIGVDLGRHYVDSTFPLALVIPPPRWLTGRRPPTRLTARLHGFSNWQTDPYQE